tara:strand:- start:203 stop:418 length:216 start_codon:yes stop_codon:yes gene_type:complete
MYNENYDNILFEVVLLRKSLRDYYQEEVTDHKGDSLNSKATLLANALQTIDHLSHTLELYDRQFINKQEDL